MKYFVIILALEFFLHFGTLSLAQPYQMILDSIEILFGNFVLGGK